MAETAGELWRAAAALRDRAALVDDRAAQSLEAEAERLEARCDELLRLARARPDDANASTVAELLAAGEAIPEPDALALALLVEAVQDSGLGPSWQRRAAGEALAWLLVGNPAASARLAELLGEVDPAEPGALLAAARGRC